MVSNLQAYKDRYDEQAKVQLQTKDSEIEELHRDLEKTASEHLTTVKQLSGEKDLLIAQNAELKKEVAQSSYDQEHLKSQVESYHSQM